MKLFDQAKKLENKINKKFNSVNKVQKINNVQS